MKGKINKITVVLICLPALILGLAGCGDDPTVNIPVITTYETEFSCTQDTEAGHAPEESMQQDSRADETGQQEETTSVAEKTEDVQITISAAGDVTLGNYLGQDFSYSFRQTYENTEDKGYFFQNVADIFREDDMTIVNLEGVLTFSEDFEEGRTFNIKGDPEYAFLLRNAGVEAVSMANNHRLDFKEAGTADTVGALEAADVLYAYDKNVGMFETKGIRIGWVSVNEVALGKNVEKYLEQGIAKLREDGADLILTCCHWGIERDNYPEDYQKELGRKCIDWGADLVIGHHPHVLQGIDMYQGKYIIYSLGNFCFGANRNPSDKDTMIFRQTFTFRPVQTDDGQVSYELLEDGEAQVIPCSVSSVSTRNNYQPTPLTGEDGQRVIGRINEYSKDFGVTADEEGILYYEGNLF